MTMLTIGSHALEESDIPARDCNVFPPSCPQYPPPPPPPPHRLSRRRRVLSATGYGDELSAQIALKTAAPRQTSPHIPPSFVLRPTCSSPQVPTSPLSDNQNVTPACLPAEHPLLCFIAPRQTHPTLSSHTTLPCSPRPHIGGNRALLRAQSTKTTSSSLLCAHTASALQNSPQILRWQSTTTTKMISSLVRRLPHLVSSHHHLLLYEHRCGRP